MTISNPSTRLNLASAAFFALCLCAHADTVELHNGDLLTGTIKSFDQGAVTLASPLALAPLEIKAEAIKRIAFPEPPADNPTHTELLTLSNKDTLPCKVLSMDKDHLHISTWYAGKFSIPRTGIRAIQFGISEEKTIFKATQAPSQWDHHEGSWSLDGTSYTSNGIGSLAQKLDLPQNLRIQFDLSWKETPNFAFRFCADTNSASTKQGTYELIFNSAGMQISRFESRSQPAAPLANIAIRPRSVTNRTLNIDIRLNRQEGLLTLYIDRKLIGTWPDPFSPTKGNYIILSNRSSSTSSCIIRNLEIRSINGSTLPRHREKNTLGKADILIDSEGEKISGTITTINKGEPNNRSLTMKVKHSTQPLRVPDRRISALLFAQPEDEPIFPRATFTAMLGSTGFLQLEKPKLIQGKLISHHPILGACSINLKAISHIKLRTPEKRDAKTR